MGFQVKAIQPTETKKFGFIFFNSLSTSIHSSPIHDGAQSRTSTRICEDKHRHSTELHRIRLTLWKGGGVKLFAHTL